MLFHCSLHLLEKKNSHITLCLTLPETLLPGSYNSLMCVLSHVQLFVTLWTVACQAPQAPLLGLFRQETGVGCRFLLQGIFPTQGSNPQRQVESLLLHHLRSYNSSISKPISILPAERTDCNLTV